MKSRITVVALAVCVAAAVSADAQTRLGGNIRATNVPTGPTPRQPDGKPDMSGVWLGGMNVGDVSRSLPPGETMPIRPEWKQKMDAFKANDDPQAHCLPLPQPRATPYPWRMVVTPTHVFFLREMYDYRQVFMDGRKHPPADEVNPTWNGHSVGRWEGDTLVIDSVGYNDKTWFDNKGWPHSDQLHLIERYTRTNAGTMKIEMTVDDPVAYTKPFTLRGEARLMPKDDELIEYVCNENNQDVPYLSGAKP